MSDFLKKNVFKFFLFLIPLLIIYTQTLTFDFVSWDDNVNIYENYFFRDALWRILGTLWTEPFERHFMPVVYSCWAILVKLDIWLRNADPFGYAPKAAIFHGVNVVLHLLNSIGVMFLVKNFIDFTLRRGHTRTPVESSSHINSDTAALLAGLFFLLHPTQVESVAWVTAFKELLFTLFSIIAINYYIKHIRHEERLRVTSAVPTPAPAMLKTKKKKSPTPIAVTPERREFYYERNYRIASFIYIIALLSKPTAFALIPICWFMEIFFNQNLLDNPLKTKFSQWLQSTYKFLPWVVFTIPVVIVTKMQQPDEGFDYLAPFWTKPFVALDIQAFYLYKTLFPYELITIYNRTLKATVENHLYLYTAPPMIALWVFIYRTRLRFPLIALSSILFVTFILPVSGIIPHLYLKTATVADRYLYPSFLGISLLVGFLLLNRRKELTLALATLVLSVYGVKSFFQCQIWQNNETLYYHTLNRFVAQPFIMNLGAWYRTKKEYQKGKEIYLMGLKAHPHNKEILHQLGKTEEELKNREAAIAVYLENIKQHPTDSIPKANLAELYANEGNLIKAMEYVDQAIQTDPKNSDHVLQKGYIYVKRNDLITAQKYFQKSLDLNPNNPSAMVNLGNCMVMNNDVNGAIENFEKAISYNPTLAEAYINLSRAFMVRGEPAKSFQVLYQANLLIPNNETIQQMMASLQQMQMERMQQMQAQGQGRMPAQMSEPLSSQQPM